MVLKLCSLSVQLDIIEAQPKGVTVLDIDKSTNGNTCTCFD